MLDEIPVPAWQAYAVVAFNAVMAVVSIVCLFRSHRSPRLENVVMPADQLQGFLGANPGYCGAAELRAALVSKGEWGAALLGQLRQVVSDLFIDRGPAFAVAFRKLE